MGVNDALDGIANKASNFQPGNMFSLFDSPFFSKVYFFGKIIFTFALVAIGCILIYKLFLQYKTKLTIFSRIGNGGMEVKTDRAKMIVDENNKRKLQLYKLRNGKQPVTLPLPDSKYKSKAGRADHFNLWLDDNYQLHPVDHPGLTEEVKELMVDVSTGLPLLDKHGEHIWISKGFKESDLLKVRPAERDGWARLEDKRLQEKYKKRDALEKFLPAGIMMMAMITAFLIWFFAAKELGAGMSSLASQFSQVAASCTRLG